MKELAFPKIELDEAGNDIGANGMSLRDYFAGQALVGMYASDTQAWHCTDVNLRAQAAYETADAMLKARELNAPPTNP